MSAVLQQLKAAYENERMTPEEIAQDQDLDIVAVKAGLMQCSSAYRKACASDGENDMDFSDQELKDVNQVIYQLAVGAESEKVRLAAATYIRDDKKGRKEVKHLLSQGGVHINILEAFNSRLAEVRQKAIEA